jgi:hypothetical protein
VDGGMQTVASYAVLRPRHSVMGRHVAETEAKRKVKEKILDFIFFNKDRRAVLNLSRKQSLRKKADLCQHIKTLKVLINRFSF